MSFNCVVVKLKEHVLDGHPFDVIPPEPFPPEGWEVIESKVLASNADKRATNFFATEKTKIEIVFGAYKEVWPCQGAATYVKCSNMTGWKFAGAQIKSLTYNLTDFPYSSVFDGSYRNVKMTCDKNSLRCEIESLGYDKTLEAGQTVEAFTDSKQLIIGGSVAQSWVSESWLKFVSFKIWEDDVLMRDIVVLKNTETSVTEMYDKVTMQFLSAPS